MNSAADSRRRRGGNDLNVRQSAPEAHGHHVLPCVEKTVYVDASVQAVWAALVQPELFEHWFRARLDRPFRVNEYSHGQSVYPGCEGLRFRAMTETMDYERLLTFMWWPAPEDRPIDDVVDVGTRVEIVLRATVDGTRVTIVESGFERITDVQKRRDLVGVRTAGWNEQASRLRQFVDAL